MFFSALSWESVAIPIFASTPNSILGSSRMVKVLVYSPIPKVTLGVTMKLPSMYAPMLKAFFLTSTSFQ